MIDEKEAAERLFVTVNSLRTWRSNGKGPRYYKVGKNVRYRPEDLDAWLESCAVAPENVEPRISA